MMADSADERRHVPPRAAAPLGGGGAIPAVFATSPRARQRRVAQELAGQIAPRPPFTPAPGRAALSRPPHVTHRPSPPCSANCNSANCTPTVPCAAYQTPSATVIGGGHAAMRWTHRLASGSGLWRRSDPAGQGWRQRQFQGRGAGAPLCTPPRGPQPAPWYASAPPNHRAAPLTCIRPTPAQPA